jgi:hypothetical protein
MSDPSNEPSQSPFPPVRRVITGHSSSGRSVVLVDESIKPKYLSPTSPIYGIHSTNNVPASNDDELNNGGKFEDHIQTLQTLAPPEGGAVMASDFPPGSVSVSTDNTLIDIGGTNLQSRSPTIALSHSIMAFWLKVPSFWSSMMGNAFI